MSGYLTLYEPGEHLEGGEVSYDRGGHWIAAHKVLSIKHLFLWFTESMSSRFPDWPLLTCDRGSGTVGSQILIKQIRTNNQLIKMIFLGGRGGVWIPAPCLS